MLYFAQRKQQLYSNNTTTMQAILANGYQVFFNESGYEALHQHLNQKKYSTIFIIVDTNTNEHCLDVFLPHLETHLKIEIIEFENGEIHKNLDTCIELWKILTDYGADRKSLIINLGGGVVTDLGGFVASTFKRGIDFINIPTSLLAMVDASVGGKTGVDLGNLKNQIGVINTPVMVIIDSNYLGTLPQNEFRSGLAEMLKHGLIYDEQYWNLFKDIAQSAKIDSIDTLIYQSVVIKNEIVTEDPRENGIRKALNFGHTLGHAIESYFLENPNKTTLLHGEAIAAGMILESYIAWQKNLISQAAFEEIKTTIKLIFDDIIFEPNDLEPIKDLLIHDKKNEYGTIQFALIQNIGSIILNQEVENQLIEAAFENYKS
ncbi:3-dehydroquinate synthase [Flavobacterium branchiophilum NBRC 15030 = ATCC 35035]|uniref:3-dehydroquinate synthase n=2 Tax=Flavobacterium branchiophilum TaxID=55197 RepID=A0A543G7Q0_9FLAO|nr:3-dehydroquinate synthase [Flavobacterium branchiophilum]GEM53888.1 3-dehydroquinate synthase [Flavobacterium branchiophilum NBRC 15030 = ATCC 35035]